MNEVDFLYSLRSSDTNLYSTVSDKRLKKDVIKSQNAPRRKTFEKSGLY